MNEVSKRVRDERSKRNGRHYLGNFKNIRQCRDASHDTIIINNMSLMRLSIWELRGWEFEDRRIRIWFRKYYVVFKTKILKPYS